jgi:prepilin-type N-terminal cleavage/methylation domain-containing protein
MALISSSHQAGYTLIELIIVIALTVILTLTAVSMFLTTLLGGGKTAAAERTKQAGQYAINQMSYLIRNSRKVSVNTDGITCGTGMTSLVIQGQDQQTTTLLSQAVNGFTRIASKSGSLTTNSYLTPDDMNVKDALTFNCSTNNDGSPEVIHITFSLQKGNSTTDKARDIVVIPFETTVSLRSY